MRAQFERPLEIDGLALPNHGLETLHHVHADDVAHWIICAIEHRAAAVGEVFNTVSPQALTLRSYAEAVYRWFEQEPSLTFAPFEQWRLTVDKSDAESTWGHIMRSSCVSIEKSRQRSNAPRLSVSCYSVRRPGSATSRRSLETTYQLDERSCGMTSLLGTRALADGVGFWDWVALVLLFLIGVLTAFMLWPYYNYIFRFDPEELLERYVDGEVAASMGWMHRTLVMRIKANMSANWRIIQPIRVALQMSLVLLLLEIAAWLLSIGGL